MNWSQPLGFLSQSFLLCILQKCTPKIWKCVFFLPAYPYFNTQKSSWFPEHLKTKLKPLAQINPKIHSSHLQPKTYSRSHDLPSFFLQVLMLTQTLAYLAVGVETKWSLLVLDIFLVFKPMQNPVKSFDKCFFKYLFSKP